MGVCVVLGDGDNFILEANLAVANCRKWAGGGGGGRGGEGAY